MSEPTNDEIRLAMAKAKGWRCIRFVSTDRNPPARTVSCIVEPGEVAVGEGSEFWVAENSDEWDVNLVPAWPTDIAAASELADELPAFTLTRYFEGTYQLSFYIAPYVSDGGCAYADTKERAICLAWLAWKGITP